MLLSIMSSMQSRTSVVHVTRAQVHVTHCSSTAAHAQVHINHALVHVNYIKVRLILLLYTLTMKKYNYVLPLTALFLRFTFPLLLTIAPSIAAKGLE